MDWIQLVLPAMVAVVAAGLMNGVGWYLRRAERARIEAAGGKMDAEASDTISAASIRMVERWEKRVRDLEEKLETQRVELQGKIDALSDRVLVLETENSELSDLNITLTRGAMRLVSQLQAHEIVPAWQLAEQS